MLQISEKSIIVTAGEALKKMSAPDVTIEDLEKWGAEYNTSLNQLHISSQQTLPPDEKRVKNLEHIAYYTLMLYSQFCILQKMGDERLPENIALWITKCEGFEKLIHNMKKVYATEHLFCHKILVFLAAIKSHLYVLTSKDCNVILTSLYNFFCSLQHYKNRVEYIRLVPGYTKNVFADESDFLFYNREKMEAPNAWSQYVTKHMDAAIGHVVVRKEYPKEDVSFIEYATGCLTNNKPVDANLPEHLRIFNYPEFHNSTLCATASLLLSKDKKLDSDLHKKSLVFAQLHFLHLQWQGIIHVPLIGLRAITSSLARNNLPFLFIHLYFLPSCELNFLGQESPTSIDVTESGRFTTFLHRLNNGVSLAYFHSLIEEVNHHTNPLLKHLFLYLLIDKVKDRSLFFDALKKIPTNKHGQPMLTTAINTLKSIFSDNSNDKKISDIKNYFIEARKNFTDCKLLSFAFTLFLICKKALELQDPQLTARVTEVLEDFKCAVTGKVIAVKPLDKSIEETLKTIQPSRPSNHAKKKSQKKKKNKKKKTPSGETQARTTAFAEIIEETVTVEPFKVAETLPQPEPRAPSPVSSNASEEERETCVSLMDYLARAKWLPAEEVQFDCPPVERLMSLFNPLATEENKYKFATFLMGGALRDVLLKKTPKDWDINIVAPEEDVRTLLETHRADLKIDTLSFIREGHPHFVLTFTDTPGIILDVSPLENTSPHSLHRFIKKRQDSLDYDVNSLFYIQFNGRKYLLDSHGALDALKRGKLNRISCEQTTVRMTTVMIRGAMLLQKSPELEPTPETVTWYEENKSLLASTPAAIRTFVKLLYSDRAIEALEAMARFGFLEQLCPELVLVFDKPHFKKWVEAFSREEGPKLLERAQTSQYEFENVHREVMIAYCNKAAEKTPVIKTDFTFVPQNQQTLLMFKSAEEDTEKDSCYTPPTSAKGTITWTMHPK